MVSWAMYYTHAKIKMLQQTNSKSPYVVRTKYPMLWGKIFFSPMSPLSLDLKMRKLTTDHLTYCLRWTQVPRTLEERRRTKENIPSSFFCFCRNKAFLTCVLASTQTDSSPEYRNSWQSFSYFDLSNFMSIPACLTVHF